MNILCLGQATIITIFLDGHTHIWHRKHIMDILYEKNLALWKIFGNWVCTCHWTECVPVIVLSFFSTYLKVETGYPGNSTGYWFLKRVMLQITVRQSFNAIINDDRQSFNVKQTHRSYSAVVSVDFYKQLSVNYETTFVILHTDAVNYNNYMNIYTQRVSTDKVRMADITMA